MTQVQIGRDDLAEVLATHPGTRALSAALESARSPERLLRVLGRYIQFNSSFGPGLANLAGEIAARPALFRDLGEPVHILQDRAAEVAADFFHAAVDEFDDRATPWRDTHRTLAQATLKGAGAHFGYAPEQLNAILPLDAALEATSQKVLHGYGVGARLEDDRLFGAMGFHAGSEVLADAEFNALDQGLRAGHPELVAALRAMKVEAAGVRHDAYYWVYIHTSVEADHFDAALAGVNKALRFYVGAADRAAAKGWILDGFRSFAEVQREFMAHLAEG